MPPVIPTAFPIPTPEMTQTVDAIFWDFNRNIAPAISMGQSVFLSANYDNILVYTIILINHPDYFSMDDYQSGQCW